MSNATYSKPVTSSSGTLETGVSIKWPGRASALPTGYLLENGQAVSRTGANAALFTILGTGFGAGNGSTTFNVRDVGNKYFIGANCDCNTGGTCCVAGTNIEGVLHACGGCAALNITISLGTTLVDNTFGGSTTSVPCCDSPSFCVCVVPPYTAEYSLIKI